MIATPKHKITAEHQQQFLAMLPTITRVARQAFSDLDPEGKEEATAEVVAVAYGMFVGLVERGRESLAYPSVLGLFGVKRVKIGRKAATKQNVLDVGSTYCQLAKGLTVDRLDRYDRETHGWHEVLLEDRHAGPAETAAARIDVSDWFKSMPPKDRKIASFLAAGNTTGETAEQFELSPGRISQKRREYREAWHAFHGESADSDIAEAVA